MAIGPVEQSLAQQSSGSAQGQGFGQFFVQGQQLAQGRRQLNLAQQRIDIERSQEKRLSEAQSLLLPLQKTALDLTNQNAGIKLKADEFQFKVMTQANAALPAIYDLMLRFQSNPEGYNNEVLRQEWRSLLGHFPSAGVSQAGQQVWQALEAQPMFEARLKRIEEAKRRLGDDLRSFNPDSGAATFQTESELAAGRLEVARANSDIARANVGLRGVGTQLRAREAGVEIDNPPTIPPPISQRAPRVDAFDGVTVTPLQSTNAPAASAAPAPTLRTVERPLTTANITALQKADLDADSALVRLDILKRTIKEQPDAFGVVGVGKEFAEILSGIANPNADASITKARQEAGLTFVELAESLRTDTGNMSRWEQERLKDLGDTRSWKDNPTRALAKADTIQKLVIGKKLRAMKALRASPDDNFLRQIEDERDVVGLYQSGLLTIEDAKRWKNLAPEPPR